MSDSFYKLIPRTTYFDTRGDLTEILHDVDLPVAEDYPHPKFGQVYVVRNELPLTVRAFHRHNSLWDFFTVVSGRARVWLISDSLQIKDFILSSKVMATLVIPPSVWHGWQSLEANTIMVCTGTHRYNRDQPDEERVDPHYFSKLNVRWGVEAR